MKEGRGDNKGAEGRERMREGEHRGSKMLLKHPSRANFDHTSEGKRGRERREGWRERE